MPLHFVFCIHNHQPVGNFVFVLEKAYRQAYVPFLDVMDRHPRQKMVFHFSGILWQWLEENHPDFLQRLAGMAGAGRIEFLSGGFYEPILAVIPEADRSGQLAKMAAYLQGRFGRAPRGLWLAERVWEPDLPSTIDGAGLDYVVVDDYHLRAAGVSDAEITVPYLTDNGGTPVGVVGGSERLRYFIPYEEPERTISFLREIHRADPGAERLVAMADDGEKFGVWPGTHRRVYDEGWLDRFFSLLEENRSWLTVSTFSEALEKARPEKTVYMPTVSYMELAEWALPPPAAAGYLKIKDLLASRPDLGYTAHFLRGGYWRNFLGKYPESRYLLGRMTSLSRKAHGGEARRCAAEDAGGAAARALDELWRGQCNDAYWHGVFGGLYLPFLRAAVSGHLLRAEGALEEHRWGEDEFLGMESADLDGDGREEVLMKNRRLTLVVDPAAGTALELGHKAAGINLFNSMTRREEAYHRRIGDLAAAAGGGGARSIHDIQRLREGQGPPRIFYDDFPRRSFVDHLWRGDYTRGDWMAGRMASPWAGKRRYFPGRWGAGEDEVSLECLSGGGDPLCPVFRKLFTLRRDGARIVVRVTFEPSADSPPFFAGQELNLTPASVGESIPQVLDARGRTIPVAPEGGEYSMIREVRVHDAHASLDARISTDLPVNLWAFPLSTVSNSEAGYEEIPQQWSLLLWREVGREGVNGLEVAIEVIQVSVGRAFHEDRGGEKKLDKA